MSDKRRKRRRQNRERRATASAGHLHHPVIESHDDVLYCNDGDWVESCSALLEDVDGQLHLIKAVGSEANAREMVIAAT